MALEVKEKVVGEKNLCGIVFEEIGLFIDGKEKDKGQEIRVFYKGKGEYEEKNAEIVLWYNKETIDVFLPTVYKSAGYQYSVGVGPQNRHWIKGYIKREGLEKLINFLDFNDTSPWAGEWHIDNIEITPSNEILVERRNNKYPEKSGAMIIKLDDYKIKIRKSLEKDVLNVEEAKTLIKKIAPRLGYDYTYDPVFPETRKDVCAVKHMTEDGSTYGFDTIYLVWKNKDGKINYKELIDSRSTKDYIHIDGIKETGNEIIVEVRSGGSYSGSPWQKTIRINKKEIGIE